MNGTRFRGTICALGFAMCSNFGFNHHPGRPPAALERRWYDALLSMYFYFRRKYFLYRIARYHSPRM